MVTAFYVIKGLVALLGTLLLLAHMEHEWRESMTWGRRMRYFTLLAYAIVQTTASVEQVTEQAPINFRNVLGMVAAGVLVAAMVVSIGETRKAKP